FEVQEGLPGEGIFIRHFGETDAGSEEPDRFSLPTLPGGFQQGLKGLAGGSGRHALAGGAGEIRKLEPDKNLSDGTFGGMAAQIVFEFIDGGIESPPAGFE